MRDQEEEEEEEGMEEELADRAHDFRARPVSPPPRCTMTVMSCGQLDSKPLRSTAGKPWRGTNSCGTCEIRPSKSGAERLNPLRDPRVGLLEGRPPPGATSSRGDLLQGRGDPITPLASHLSVPGEKEASGGPRFLCTTVRLWGFRGYMEWWARVVPRSTGTLFRIVLSS